jgi:hypothetical protein
MYASGRRSALSNCASVLRETCDDGIELGLRPERALLLSRGEGLSTLSFSGFTSIIPRTTARANTCRSA